MWTYYGTKKKIAKHYPTPLHDKIIEPFAGAAQYSLYGDNWKKDVLLIDKYDVITDLWKYLINATPQDILSLPDMGEGENVDTHTHLCKEEKYLIGFCINSGSAQPKKTVKKFNCWNRSKISIAEIFTDLISKLVDKKEARRLSRYCDNRLQYWCSQKLI